MKHVITEGFLVDILTPSLYVWINMYMFKLSCMQLDFYFKMFYLHPKAFGGS